MEFLKNQKTSLFVTGILFVVYNVLYFAIPFPKNTAAWICYVFTLCSFFVSYWIFYTAFRGTETLTSKVYGFPVFRLGYIYLSIQVVFGFLIDFLGYLIKIPGWIAVVVSVLLLAFALIGTIATDAARDAIEKQQEEVQLQTEKITYFRLDVAGLADRVSEGEVKKNLEKLSEDARFSDPVSSDTLKEIEDRLTSEVERLRGIISEGSEKDCLVQIDSVRSLLADRNRRCKALKGR